MGTIFVEKVGKQVKSRVAFRGALIMLRQFLGSQVGPADLGELPKREKKVTHVREHAMMLFNHTSGGSILY